MATNKSTTTLAAVLLVVAVAAVSVLLQAPAAEAVCNMSNDDFMLCQPAAAKTTGPAEEPSKACCDALGAADLGCLCGYKNSPWMSLYNIDPQRAMGLPAKCGLATPPNC